MIVKLCSQPLKRCKFCQMTYNACDMPDGIPYRYECIGGGDCKYVKLYDDEKKKVFARPRGYGHSTAQTIEDTINAIGYDKAPKDDVHCKVYSQDHTLYVAQRKVDGTYGEPKKIKCDLFFNTSEKEYEDFIKTNEDNQ